jgi:hypothetical protein
MRTEMREQSRRSEMKEMISKRNDYADRLVEKWSRKKGIGDGMKEMRDMNPTTARNTSIILENQENHLARLTETQISNSFSTTPENVIRVVRLGYPNSVRGELFLEWGMETARDSIYYLSSVYGKNKRGSTLGDAMKSSDTYRYASEIEIETLGTGDGSTHAFNGAVSGNLVANGPLRPYSVQVLVDGAPVATDNGSGGLTGTVLNSSETNTINYTTGEVTVTFTTPPDNGDSVQILYFYDSEEDTQYDDIGSVELQLRDYQFRVKPWPLYVSWSKMTELLINTTLNIDAEDALVRGAADELKKSLDYHAVRMAYRASRGNTAVSFDVQGAVGEAESDRAMAFSRTIDEAGDVMYSTLQRGGVTHMVGGPNAVSYVKLHARFSGEGAQPKVGIYREGSLDGISLYKAPPSVVPNDEILFIYHNADIPEDVSLAFGTLVPLYRTQTLEYKEFYSETGLAFFGDAKVLQSNYLVRGQIQHL